MKKLTVFFTGMLYLVFFISSAQNTEKCSLCKMEIKQTNFKTKAKSEDGKVEQFGSIECMVTYVDAKNEPDFFTLTVSDFVTENEVQAKNAYYLRSDKVPSPMGANISAYATKKEAVASKKKNGGKVLDWEQLKQLFASPSFELTTHDHHNHGPNNYASSGVMGDHLHPKGGLMVSLRFMHMAMSGNREGTEKIADERIYQSFMVAPQEMTMQMYMLGVMYAPSDKITLMLMQNFAKKDMDLTAQMMMGNGMPMLTDFSTSSTGLGDLKLGMLYGVYSNPKSALHLNTTINLPIGDIENRDATPMMADAKLPYAMQLGSGTVDFTLGATLKGEKDNFSWGIQQLNTFRFGKNSEDYRFGNLHELNTWLGYEVSSAIGFLARVSGSTQATIDGVDTDLNPMMAPTANPTNYGGENIIGGVGTNILLAQSKLILGLEITAPLYQNYNGIFMNTDYTFNACIKYNIL